MKVADDEQLIRENNRLRELLDTERKRFLTVLNSIVDGVYLTDPDRNITFWNSGAERITGFMAANVVGSSCKSLLSHVDESGNSLCEKACPLSETMENSVPVFGKNVYSCSSHGRTIPVSVSCAPLIDSEGNTVGAVEVFRDISAQKELEKQKTDFYSMITHDIKSPLTLIMGYSELIQLNAGACTEDEMREYAKHITNSSSRIKDLVEDFLSVSKLSAGSTELVKEPIIVEDLLKISAGELSPHTGTKLVTLSYEISDRLPVIHADPKMLNRALSNLIVNAIKYTPEGGSVTVAAKFATSPGSGGPCRSGCVEITVTDTGRGIREEEMGQIFDMYFRAGNNSGVDGTGLGLAIVKAVCEAHGGNVSLTSTVGKGSSFTIQLPVGSADIS